MISVVVTSERANCSVAFKATKNPRRIVEDCKFRFKIFTNDAAAEAVVAEEVAVARNRAPV